MGEPTNQRGRLMVDKIAEIEFFVGSAMNKHYGTINGALVFDET